MPSTITKGDSYNIINTYTTNNLSGSTVNCSSNLDTNKNITNTNQLTTTGKHNITCTVKTGAGKTTTVTKNIEITYQAYTITNLITNGSFENGIDGCYGTCPNLSGIGQGLYGNYSIIVNSSLGLGEIAAVPKNGCYLIQNHKYYSFLSVYIYSYTQGPFVALHISGLTAIILNAEQVNKSLQWQKVSGIGIAENSTGVYNDIRIGKSYNHQDVIWSSYFDGIAVIDLTATFGSGNEPDKEWCDKHINYFDGTATIYM